MIVSETSGGWHGISKDLEKLQILGTPTKPLTKILPSPPRPPDGPVGTDFTAPLAAFGFL
jgi:hypothetical protein